MLGWMRMKKNRFLGPWEQSKLTKKSAHHFWWIYKYNTCIAYSLGGWSFMWLPKEPPRKWRGKRKRCKWIRKGTEDWSERVCRVSKRVCPRVIQVLEFTLLSFVGKQILFSSDSYSLTDQYILCTKRGLKKKRMYPYVYLWFTKGQTNWYIIE